MWSPPTHHGVKYVHKAFTGKAQRFPKTHAVADTGATSVLVMADTPMKNVRIGPNLLNINLPDGKMVHSTHICDVELPGLPHVLKGHIVPALMLHP